MDDVQNLDAIFIRNVKDQVVAITTDGVRAQALQEWIASQARRAAVWPGGQTLKGFLHALIKPNCRRKIFFGDACRNFINVGFGGTADEKGTHYPAFAC